MLASSCSFIFIRVSSIAGSCVWPQFYSNPKTANYKSCMLHRSFDGSLVGCMFFRSLCVSSDCGMSSRRIMHSVAMPIRCLSQPKAIRTCAHSILRNRIRVCVCVCKHKSQNHKAAYVRDTLQIIVRIDSHSG